MAGICKQGIYKNFYGTITNRHNFNVEAAADALHTSFRQATCNKLATIEMILKATNAQRQQVRAIYQQKYHEDLLDRLRQEFTGELDDVITGLMLPPISYDVVQLHNAIKLKFHIFRIGFHGCVPYPLLANRAKKTKVCGTRESILIDILLTRSSSEIKAIKAEYEKTYKISLAEDISKEISGDFREILLSLLDADKNQAIKVDYNKAKNDARKMFGSYKQKRKPDKATFVDVFSKCNFAQSECTFAEYQRISGCLIQKGIKNVFDGDAREAYMQVYSAMHNLINYYATNIHESFKSFGTRGTDLVRIIISRSERDLEAIKEEYKRTYQIPLTAAIYANCTGVYRDALIAILDGN